MSKVRTIQNLSIDDPEYTRDGPIEKKTRNGGFEMREEEATKAALAASLHDMGSPAGEPVILDGQPVPPGVAAGRTDA